MGATAADRTFPQGSIMYPDSDFWCFSLQICFPALRIILHIHVCCAFTRQQASRMIISQFWITTNPLNFTELIDSVTRPQADASLWFLMMNRRARLESQQPNQKKCPNCHCRVWSELNSSSCSAQSCCFKAAACCHGHCYLIVIRASRGEYMRAPLLEIIAGAWPHWLPGAPTPPQPWFNLLIITQKNTDKIHEQAWDSSVRLRDLHSALGNPRFTC